MSVAAMIGAKYGVGLLRRYLMPLFAVKIGRFRLAQVVVLFAFIVFFEHAVDIAASMRIKPFWLERESFNIVLAVFLCLWLILSLRSGFTAVCQLLLSVWGGDIVAKYPEHKIAVQALYLSLPFAAFFASLVWRRMTRPGRPPRDLSKWMSRIAAMARQSPSKAGYEFERFVKELMLRNGLRAELAEDLKSRGQYPPEFVNNAGGDGGIDVVAYDSNKIYLIQTKYKLSRDSKVKGEHVSKTLVAGRIFSRYYRSLGDNRQVETWVVTNGLFDATALEHARELGTRIFNRENLREWMSGASKAA